MAKMLAKEDIMPTIGPMTPSLGDEIISEFVISNKLLLINKQYCPLYPSTPICKNGALLSLHALAIINLLFQLSTASITKS